MGGYGSGRRRYSKQATTSVYLQLDIRKLASEGFVGGRTEASLCWGNGSSIRLSSDILSSI